ncbi:SMC-Scp complex subunit ScpB, partial [Candidatus Woesearchaeota archaeon]|nr:SMC-Scp complex subunit ScpB [Candidatus Woesearchaeota archaeon]
MDDKLKRDTEALLFASGRAMSEEALCNILNAFPKDIKRVLKELHDEYRERDAALMIFQEGEAWKMLVRDAHIPVVQRV